MKKKILIHHFHCLNNYGSGMMGIITLKKLFDFYGNNAEFYFQSNGFSTIQEIKNEVGQDINLKIHSVSEINWSKFKWIRSLQKRKYLIDISEIKKYDAIVILGGDDLSEYYTKKIYRDLLKYWRWSLSKKIFLLGQSIGPFQEPKNRWVMKNLYKKIPIFVRDSWSKEYLKKEFNLSQNVWQSADIAFLDLPLQHNKDIEKEILQRYNLVKGKYINLVISGLVGKYYTQDKQKYYDAYFQIINNILKDERFKDFKIVLLAHTFPPHGNEAQLIKELINKFSLNDNERIVPITEKILQTRARFILGNGFLTITGRMHAAISTFQMGKPAISLSYSAKYKGVIGMNLNRNDLIIESNEPELWNSGKIVDLIQEKVDYIFDNYLKITEEIQQKIEEQKKMVDNSFTTLTKKI